MAKRKRTMMGIECPTGSHLPVLEQQARAATGLVIEHGAGLYSTPLLARLGCRVLCAEPHEGWREWANWIYQDRAELAVSIDAILPRLPEASLVFIDGPANERGTLLQACLDCGVPSIIVHDTDEGDWAAYGLQPHHFMVTRYAISHSAIDRHRTTLWVRKAPMGIPFDP